MPDPTEADDRTSGDTVLATGITPGSLAAGLADAGVAFFAYVRAGMPTTGTVLDQPVAEAEPSTARTEPGDLPGTEVTGRQVKQPEPQVVSTAIAEETSRYEVALLAPAHAPDLSSVVPDREVFDQPEPGTRGRNVNALLQEISFLDE